LLRVNSASWQPTSSVDRGQADADVRVALAAAYTGGDSYARAIAALCTARLILPTVDAPAEAEPGASKKGDDHDHSDADSHGHPELAAVLLRSASGEKAVLAFTGMDALAAWRPDAHPVRCTLDDVAATVAETESSTIVIDVAGPHQLVIESELVAELAQGHRLAELEDGSFAWVWVDGSSGA